MILLTQCEGAAQVLTAQNGITEHPELINIDGGTQIEADTAIAAP